MKQLRRRVDTIQRTIDPPRTEGRYTLEELMRVLWESDRPAYMRFVQEGFPAARLLLPRFEQEDREAAHR